MESEALQQILSALLDLTATDWAAIAALFLAVITFIGLLITRRAHRAMVFIEMDRRWNSPEMLEARQLVRDQRDTLIDLIARNHSKLDDTRKAKKLGQEFNTALLQMRKNDRNKYALALRYCGFL